MLRAQVSLQVVKIGERNSLDMKLKEQHIQHLRLIQGFFERKYREMYGRDFVPIKEIVNP